MRPTRSPRIALLCLPLLACSDGAATTATAPTGEAATTEAAGTSGPATTGAATTGAATTTIPHPDTTGATTGDEPAPTTGAGATTADSTGTASSGTSDGASSTGDGGGVEELPPVDSVESLEAWLAGGAYKQWAAESTSHASTGPHGGNVRTWINAVALGSLEAGDAEHPADAATVKELYGDSMDTVIGYAVSLKTQAQSEGGANWYWYERVNDTTYASSLDVPLCSGCHGGGADYILTPYPLQ